MWKKELRKYDVNEDVFNKILHDFEAWTILVEDINIYKFGFKGTDLEKKKNTIVFDGNSWLVMPEYLLNGVLNDHQKGRYDYEDVCPLENTWRQCSVRLTREQNTEVEVGVNGWYAYNYMMKLLSEFYNSAEIEERLAMFEAEYNPNKIQEHFVLADKNELLEFDNCYKYDINSAHASALLEVFPKAAKKINWLYDTRKKHPKNKAILNYFVGYLCCVEHRKTYNWIVQRTTDILRNAVNTTKGNIIYANTDGFIVWNPDMQLNASKIIGEFKEEYHGIVRFYKDKNWFVYELDEPEKPEDRHKGTLALSVRDQVSLKDRTIIHYDKQKTEHAFKIINITKEII